MRKQFVEREAAPDAGRARYVNHGIGAGKFPDALPAPSAWRHQMFAIADHHDCGNPAVAGCDHRRNCSGFGTTSHRISRVFDIAAREDATVDGRDSRPDLEVRIRRISLVLSGAGSLEKPIEIAHVSAPSRREYQRPVA